MRSAQLLGEPVLDKQRPSPIKPAPRVAATIAATLVLSVLTTGCSGSSSDTKPEVATDPLATTEPVEPSPSDGGAMEISTPDIPGSYRYRLTSSCGHRPLIGSFRVKVVDGKVVSAKPLPNANGYQPRLEEIPTLMGLREMAEAADKSTIVDYQVDDMGYPTLLSLDPLPQATDDEECYEVTNLRVP